MKLTIRLEMTLYYYVLHKKSAQSVGNNMQRLVIKIMIIIVEDKERYGATKKFEEKLEAFQTQNLQNFLKLITL